MKNIDLDTIVDFAKAAGKLMFVAAYTGIFLYIGYEFNSVVYRRNQNNKPLLHSYSYQSVEVYGDKIVKDSQVHEELPLILFNQDSHSKQGIPESKKI